LAGKSAQQGAPSYSRPAERFSAGRNADVPSQTQQPGKRVSGDISFEGSFTPSLRLLPDERIMDVFEARLWDLGVFGWLFGYKRRLVLTSQRLIRFDKRIIDNTLEIVRLDRVKSVVVGQTVNAKVAAIGLSIIMMSLMMAVGLADRVGSGGALFLFVLFSTLGLVICWLARIKVMFVSTGVDKVGMRLTRIKSEESKRFADKVCAALAGRKR
jgi:hypothetical protein